MTFLEITRRPAVALALVGVSGFGGGAVFLPAMAQSAQPRDPLTLFVAGLFGACAYLLLWLAASAALAGPTGITAGRLLRRTALVFAVSLAPLISYFPYLIYRTSLEGESVELPPLGTRYSSIALLVWSLLLLAALLRLTLGSNESRLLNRLTRRPALTLIIMMAVWLVVFFILDVVKDQYMQVTTVNSALFKEAMTHVFDSRGFMFSNLLYGSGATLFGVHINAIFLFVLPVFRLWPDYRWLLLLGDIALALSAWPAYLIARRLFSPALSLLLAAMVLLNPILCAQPGRSDFSEMRFMPVLFLTAFYLFEKKHFWAFAATALAMMTIREDMGLFIGFFGIYGLIRRRSLKWTLAPLVGGFGWFALMGAVLLPRLGPSGTAVRASLRYSNLGSSGSEIARTIIFRPWKAIQAATATSSHIGAIYGILLISGLGLAFLSGAVIFAIPAMAELLFQQTTTFNNFMAVPLVPTLAVAVILGLARLDHFYQRRFNLAAGRAAVLTGVFVFFVTSSPFHTWYNPDLYRPRYNYDAALEAFNQVPANASLMMPEFMLAYSAPGQTVRGFHQVWYQEQLDGRFDLTEDYVIIDRRRPARLASDNHYYDGIDEALSRVTDSSEFTKVMGREDIELYVRNGADDGG